jgi:hypothetical protein
MTFPRWLIESGLGEPAVHQVLGGDRPPATADPAGLRAFRDQPVSIDQMRLIAVRSRRRFWRDGDWIRERPLPTSDVTSRRLTAAEALDLVGPVGLDEVHEKGSFSVLWHDRGWLPLG